MERPKLVDWRDAEERLATRFLVDHVGAIVKGLRPGERLILVVPDSRPQPTDTTYVRMFRAQGRDAPHALRTNGRLGLVARSDFSRRLETAYPLTGYAFERIVD